MTREEILDDYYSKYFEPLCNSGANGWGSAKFHRNIEKDWKNKNPLRILEVGAGSGNDLKFCRDLNPKELIEYVALDLRDQKELLTDIRVMGFPVTWVVANIQNIPFNKSRFDRVISTCLFHHVDDPYAAFLELRRVTSNGGEISIGMPTDPGIANQIVKKLLTFKKAKKLGVENPEFIYSLEHGNHFLGLLRILREVHKRDQVRISYWPLKIPNWHLNLSTNIHIIVDKSLD